MSDLLNGVTLLLLGFIFLFFFGCFDDGCETNYTKIQTIIDENYQNIKNKN